MKQIFRSLIFVCLSAVSAQAADITGPVRVVDGNTLDVGGQVVRLYGIQAPHLEQTCRTRKGQEQQCGRISSMGLTEMVRGPEARCEDKGLDTEGRRHALCFIGWLNLSEEMVASGYALADPVTGADFQRAETFAQARKEGLWRTEFTKPWEWQGQGQ